LETEISGNTETDFPLMQKTAASVDIERENSAHAEHFFCGNAPHSSGKRLSIENALSLQKTNAPGPAFEMPAPGRFFYAVNVRAYMPGNRLSACAGTVQRVNSSVYMILFIWMTRKKRRTCAEFVFRSKIYL
jgi:hypothetical protein